MACIVKFHELLPNLLSKKSNHINKLYYHNSLISARKLI
ncbi:hypothetical protein A1OE_203 [Candidatus Endolissoclinum faulkneri L2]|uniref:Uncharacterized protein n=1 Tax=Candidatus Endolissoclinum faulkneri L2 TaxID=1193729 RepID=K7YFQ5_9PROT|nr:hypothetical protein A1OE_203 [Candidatus Endolissoclinum faulkneri L2]